MVECAVVERERERERERELNVRCIVMCYEFSFRRANIVCL